MNMEKREWKFTDKSKWSRGEWDNEPDKAQWTDEKTGLPCLIVRGPAGALCGYVGVAEGHRFFAKEYSSCIKDPPCEESCYEHSPGAALDVHGGITFSDFCAEDREQGICHIPAEGEPARVYWFGFDCAHSGDVSPKYDGKYGRIAEFESYKPLQYVKNQCAELARQLAGAIQ